MTRISDSLPAAPSTESKVAKITDGPKEGQKGLKINVKEGVSCIFLELYRSSFLTDHKASLFSNYKKIRRGDGKM